MKTSEAPASSLRDLWALDPAVTFLNHGSFGACPRVVLDAAARLRERLEHEPVRFFLAEREPLLDEARAAVGAFTGASAADLVFVPNATAGVGTVLASLALAPGDELLTTDHAYNACRNALDLLAERTGARVVVGAVPFPTPGPDAVVEAVLARVTPRTRLALIDQVASQTALVLPVDRLVAELSARGVDTLVDAAHAPGMVPLHLDATGAAYTTGNFHKWLCAPKGAAFLHVRRDRQAGVHPLATSHGRNSPRKDRSRFRLEHDWTGTFDPAPYLCVPEALRFLETLLPGGIAAWMAQNHAAALAARDTLCHALGIEAPCPDTMIGSMASVPLPAAQSEGALDLLQLDPLHETLFARFGIEVPVFPWPAPPQRMLRVSTPAYVGPADVDRLVAALGDLGVLPHATGSRRR
jgi:isopenicillin-N epimerase